jgi:hypothetical protein
MTQGREDKLPSRHEILGMQDASGEDEGGEAIVSRAWLVASTDRETSKVLHL